ncbi:MAG: hypothetical protein HXS40_11980 [Theionarchaea archaeon]|nr:hypothetical protein [Theionarchaea archaeon]
MSLLTFKKIRPLQGRMRMRVDRTFHHGIPYTFSFDEEKIVDSENGYKNRFLDYARSLLNGNLPDGFSAPPRASGMRFPMLESYPVEHPLREFARHCHRVPLEGSRHERMQTFLMLSDKASVAVEVPVWMTPKESRMFDSNLTGHIDLVRLTDKVEVWDYKPYASQEIFACCQVYWYTRMLSARLRVSLDAFRCGFFDAYNVYIIEPEYIPFQRTLTDYVKS